MFWNVTFIYNAFIRTTDHCKVLTAFVSLFYIFINMKPWNVSYSLVVVVGLLLIMLNDTINANLPYLAVLLLPFKFYNIKIKITHITNIQSLVW